MMKCNIRSLYLCVKNMDRAIAFYENFFEMKVAKRDDIYSVFNVNGFRLGLFAFEKMGEDHIYGSNCLPSIDVENIGILKNKIKHLNLCFPLTKIDENWVVEFIDSEGNHIEVTAPIE